MKKFLAIIMALLMMLSLVACGDNAKDAGADADEEVEEEESSDKKDKEDADADADADKDVAADEDADAEKPTEEKTTEVDNEAVIAEKLELNKDEILELFDATDSTGMEFSIKAEGNSLVVCAKYLEVENVSDAMKAELQISFDVSKGEQAPSVKKLKEDYIPEVEFVKFIVCDKDDNVLASFTVDENTVSDEVTAEEYVEVLGDSFVSEVEGLMKSAGFNSVVTIEADTKGIVVQITYTDFTNLTDEQKESMKETAASEEQMENSWGPALDGIRSIASDVEYLKIIFCDGNGDVITEVVVK